MTIFGAIGLVLVTIGVYSVLAYTTGATNARDWDSNGAGSERLGRARLVIRMGLRLVGIGVGLGLNRQPGR